VHSLSFPLFQQVLGAADPLRSAPLLSLAAGVLDSRLGFETETAYLRGVAQAGNEALCDAALRFLERPVIRAALLPHAEALAESIGLKISADALRDLTLPVTVPPVPWWFEAKHSPKAFRGYVPMSQGALAVGHDKALDWLLAVRNKAIQREMPKGFSAAPHLIWIPDDVSQAIALNVLGGIFRDGGERFEAVNEAGRTRIRALFPFPKPQDEEYFLMDRGLKGLCRLKTLCEEEKYSWKILHERVVSMARRVPRVREIQSDRTEGRVRRTIVVKTGLRVPLAPSVVPYPLHRGEPTLPELALRTFENQFWTDSPEQMAEKLGEEGMRLLPDRLMVSQYQYLHPQALIMPGYGVALLGRPNARIFLIQGTKAWVAQPTSGGIRNSETDESLVAYLRSLTGIPYLMKPRRAVPPMDGAPQGEQPEENAGPHILSTSLKRDAALDPTEPMDPDVMERLREEARTRERESLAYDATSPEGARVIASGLPRSWFERMKALFSRKRPQ